jgi:hypothetical protein
MFENDGNHWYDRDDFIAKHTITESPSEITLEFKATGGHALGAHYALNVSVDPPIQTAILRLRSITCLRQAETFTDELYVTFNGTKRALPDMTQGQSKDLSDEFIFEGSRELMLFENDGNHWYDRDDFITRHTITVAPSDVTLDFKATSGNAKPAHYQLSITTTPGP